MTDLLTRDAFDPHVNKVFRVKGGHHALMLTRIEARAQEEWEKTMGQRAPFNLIFRGPSDDLLLEGLYTMEVEDGIAFDLYMIPIYTPFPGRQDYQSSFN
jgi:hypothetical protein